MPVVVFGCLSQHLAEPVHHRLPVLPELDSQRVLEESSII